MSNTLQVQAPSSKQYIKVHPDFFAEVFHDKLDLIDSEILRESESGYNKTEDDEYLDNRGVDFTVELWKHFDTAQQLVYVPHTGRLYSCWSVLEAADIMRFLIDNEAAKIKKPE